MVGSQSLRNCWRSCVLNLRLVTSVCMIWHWSSALLASVSALVDSSTIAWARFCKIWALYAMPATIIISTTQASFFPFMRFLGLRGILALRSKLLPDKHGAEVERLAGLELLAVVTTVVEVAEGGLDLAHVFQRAVVDAHAEG